MTAETKTVHRIRCDHHYCEITWTGGFGHDWAHTWSAAYDAGWSHGYHRGLHYCPAHQPPPEESR